MESTSALDTDNPLKSLSELYVAGRDGELISMTNRLLSMEPENGALWKVLGAVYVRAKESAKAYAAVRCSVVATAWSDEALWNFGLVLEEIGELDLAIQQFKQYLCANPNDLAVYTALAEAFYRSMHYENTIVHADRATLIRPRDVAVKLTKGAALRKLKRLEEAESEFSIASKINPSCCDTLFNLGSINLERGRCAIAALTLSRVIALDPSFFGGYLNLGKAAKDLRDFDCANSALGRASRLCPDHEFLLGARLDVQLSGVNWRSVESDICELKCLVREGRRAAASLTVLAVTDDPLLQLQAAQIFTKARYRSDRVDRGIKHPVARRIRIGYFSADFRNHPTSHLIAGLFESHDRQKFEVFAFNLWSATHDWMTERIRRVVDRFIDITDIPDAQVVSMCLDMGLDIAVDLMGYTEHCRTGIFAARCAPIQISYLGYIGSMGASFIDYLVADRLVVDSYNRASFDEKIIFLPDCFQVNDDQRKVSSKSIDRKDAGLPADSFVYCCFNGTYKITPDVFSLWMRILHEVPRSVLWLVAANQQVEKNFRREAEVRGVTSSRLIFSDRLPYEDYLARFRLADLFLDTFPYNGGATSSDALWAGLPVQTLAGQSYVSRMGRSLLTAFGLPELVSSNADDYVFSAVSLGTNPEKLAELRNRLGICRRQTSLFDVRRFAVNFERGLVAAYERKIAGGLLSDIVVEAVAS